MKTDTDSSQRLPSSLEYRRYLLAVTLFHQAAADAVGLSGTDHQASLLLDLEGPLTSGELARRLGLSTGATTRLVDRLIAAGIAERTVDATDRRRALVAHTGRQPPGLDAILTRVRPPIHHALTELTAEQLEGVRRYLAAATAAFSQAARDLHATDSSATTSGRAAAAALRPARTTP